MTTLHYLGVPRVGPQRELKWALEGYWRGDTSRAELDRTTAALKQEQWQRQIDSGADFVTVGDFAHYDHVLNHSLMFGLIPERFRELATTDTLDLSFMVARGLERGDGDDLPASPMLKWFDTNYHYIAPELDPETQPELNASEWLAEIEQARDLNHPVKPVLLGPITLLWLSRTRDCQPLDWVDSLTARYRELLSRLPDLGVEWVQVDEPVLSLDLPLAWRQAFEHSWQQLGAAPVRILLTQYFGELADNLGLALNAPVDGIHLDLISAPDDLPRVLDRLGPNKILSVGIINGRNVWRANIDHCLRTLLPLRDQLAQRLWISSSCSLLHVPYDVEREQQLPVGLREGLAFLYQKQAELSLLRDALDRPQDADVRQRLDAAAQRQARLGDALGRQRAEIRARLDNITPDDRRRETPFSERRRLQQQALNLPLFPTTTIGSFPQTTEVRRLRRDWKRGQLDDARYRQQIEAIISATLREQEAVGLDVLAHGEAERNDMVEYFGEQLEGFISTRFGWVQSFGSRCVKPPLIHGDVHRPTPMTVDWARFAASQTDKPVKGMLTGPVTMIAWSFPREDVPLSVIADQIGLALRDEIADLEQAGIGVIQVDEPAFREKLPLRERRRRHYLEWATAAFRLATSGVAAETQIHTHMCYSEFSDILDGIRDLQADVITIEAARSEMALVDDLAEAGYNRDIGPGIYDIHSPLTPDHDTLVRRLKRVTDSLPAERIWVNPDCGLKTRGWPETRAALTHMVEATRKVRETWTQTNTEPA